MQCLAEADILIEDVLPGVDLVIGTKTVSDKWIAGELALVITDDDPDFILPSYPVSDIETYDDPEDPTDAEMARFRQFMTTVKMWEDRLVTDPLSGYRLVAPAVEAGYDQTEFGRFAVWLVEHIAGHELLPPLATIRKTYKGVCKIPVAVDTGARKLDYGESDDAVH